MPFFTFKTEYPLRMAIFEKLIRLRRMQKFQPLLFLLLPLFGFSQKLSWEKLNDFPGLPFDDGISFTYQNQVYVTGGLNSGFYIAPDIWQFDPDSETWNNRGFINYTPRQYASGFYWNDHFCIAGGKAGSTLQDCQCMGSNPNLWTPFPFPFGPARKQQVSGNVEERIFFGLGSNGSSCFNDWWEFSLPDSTWLKKPAFPGEPRKEAVLSNWGKVVFVGLGIDSSEKIGFHDWYSYEPNSAIWQRKSDFPGKNIQYGNAFSFADGIVVLGGMDPNRVFYNEAYFYKPYLDEWIELGELPFSPRKGMNAVSMGNSIYLISGIDSSYHRTPEVWKGKFTPSESGLHVFPNPVQNELVIQGSTNMNATIRLWNLSGEKIQEWQISKVSWSQLDISFIESGFYLLEIEKEDGKTIQKLIKTKG